MGHVVFARDGSANGMDDAILGVGKAHAGNGRGVEHVCPGSKILTVGVGAAHAAGYELHGMKIQGVGNGSVSLAAEGFHGVHKGVDACGCRDARGKADSELGIEDDRSGVHVVRHNTPFAAVLGVGKDGDGSHFRTGAGCGGHKDHGRQGIFDLAHAKVLVDGALVGEKHSAGLGGIQGRAATKPKMMSAPKALAASAQWAMESTEGSSSASP